MMDYPEDAARRLRWLRTLAGRMRDATLEALRSESVARLAEPAGVRGGDLVYRLDERAEEPLLAGCAEWGREEPFLLVAEGLEGGQRVFPAGAPADRLAFTLIVDPVDGTRGLMYAKRSAWALFGVAPAPRPSFWPSLADITLALQAELPTPRAALADTLWAVAGHGASGETLALRDLTVTPFTPQPSGATSLVGGFAGFAKYFPGVKARTAAIEEAFFQEVMGPPPESAPQVFDDQYISSGGQLYELMVGHDRFVADIRPLFAALGIPASLCAHPYDLCTELIAREAGVVVCDPWGARLRAPLDTGTPVAWVGYASEPLRAGLEPALQWSLREAGLSES
ncbi:MAG TPA: inositol monophosphatase [Ktedonobacterales bacterium]